jgi:hypothetical protein
MATITRKFSKTQQALWNQIRHAFPEGLGEHGPAQWHRGAISAGHNLTATVKALESLGLIRIQEIGGRISDRVIPVCPLGERSVVLMPKPAEWCAWHGCTVARITSLGNHHTYVNGTDIEAIAEKFRADGWNVTILDSYQD